MNLYRRFFWAVVMTLPLCASTVAARALPHIVLTPVATGAGEPVMVAEPDDGSGRLFVVDRTGALRIIDHGKLLPTPYLSIDVPTQSEQGLVGLAFDPGFATNGRVYVTFTAPSSEPRLGAMEDQVLARFTASNPAANVFAGTRTDVLRIPDIYANHNGGDIHFGPDGTLYWGMGDGGDGGDPHGFAQNLWRKNVGGHTYFLLGKMLRLDVRHGTSVATSETCGGAVGTTLQYKIPAGNPFAGAANTNTCDEIYDLGLRNPWRFSFDRDNGDLYIADVGQSAWEEIDVVAADDIGGHNFGWNCREGHVAYLRNGSTAPAGCNPMPPNLTGPVFDYSHSYGCSITGGYIYRGPDTALNGFYFYGDFCDTKVFYADPQAGIWHAGGASIPGQPMSSGLDLGAGGRPIGFGEDLAGRVYVTTYNGSVYRIDSDALFADGFE